MNSPRPLLSLWSWDPLSILLCLLALGAVSWHFRSARRTAVARARESLLVLGLALLVLGLLSPLAVLARNYLFSAHMAQHLLLLLVVPVLLLLGLPQTGVASERRETGEGFGFGGALATWLAGVAAMWVWHIPALCSAATADYWTYHVQTISLLVLGTLFWWPIAGPNQRHHLSAPAGVAYLVTACFACTLLGIYITFAPVSVCPIYVHPADPYGLLSKIQTRWGLTAQVDQQIGGLMMWVPACLIYLSGVMGLLFRWYGHVQAPSIAVSNPHAT